MRLTLIITVAFVLLAAAVSCAKKNEDSFVEWVNAAEVDPLIAQKSPLVIDIRTVPEYRGGHIAGALNLPLADLGRSLKAISPETPVLIYCNTENRVRASLEEFRAHGFKKVYIIRGGYTALRAFGYPLVK